MVRMKGGEKPMWGKIAVMAIIAAAEVVLEMAKEEFMGK